MAGMKFVALLVFLQTLYLVQSEELNDCANLQEETCALCLIKPGCAWCSDEVYRSPRCNTQANHAKLLCPSNSTINPQSEQTLDQGSSGSQISPSKAKLTVRVEEPLTFTISVKPAKDYPVDLYYLMDLSATMRDDLDQIKKLGSQISTKLSELTKKQRLAFGSFVDKTVAPYVKFETIGKPFCKDNKCDVPYDFKHVLDFTDSGSTFENTVQNVKSSGNLDVAEGTLDALMQIAACEKELKWRPANSSRRMVLITTDGLFHMAGDGKLGGIVKPNDGKCHLSNKDDKGNRYYSEALTMDYPSVDQIFKRLEASNIQPIFAVPKSTAPVKNTYQTLEKSWVDLSATYGDLDEDSGNILDLIEKSYKTIVQRVRINTRQAPDDIEVSVTPKCGSATELGNECTDVKPGDKVEFEISIKAKSCNNGNSSKFKLVSPGFGEIDIDLSIICSCKCQEKKTYNSSVCNGNGTLVCGRCDCNSGWSGRNCECDPSKTQASGQDKECKRNNATNIICDGNGDCDCGKCQCNLIGNTGLRYYGQYCQCNDYNCEQHENELCGGKKRGICKCGQCRCNRGYIGSNCGKIDCSLEIEKCLNKGVNCSGQGSCNCGTCNCNPFWQGPFCDDCPSCAGRCDDYEQCVKCEVFGHVPANKSLCANCRPIEILSSVEELRNLQFPELCRSVDSDGCTFQYTYGAKKGENITIYAVSNKDCPEGPDVLLIVLAVIGGIVGMGIILLILWKLLTAMVDRREYQKFEQDRAKSKWHREKNPLYQPATSTVQNPTFVGARKE